MANYDFSGGGLTPASTQPEYEYPIFQEFNSQAEPSQSQGGGLGGLHHGGGYYDDVDHGGKYGGGGGAMVSALE